jgi:ribA/ribD-fused uncharacterized protein
MNSNTTPSHHPALTPTVPGHFETDRYVFFWSGPFSNWTKGEFTMLWKDEEITFNCSEQAMMYFKALTFGDFDAAGKVMKTKDARKQKEIGRRVRNFDQSVWEAHAMGVMPEVLAAKFTDVPGYSEILLGTGNKTIVEASPFDAVWGIKMGVNHPDLLDESKWQGKNLLGICLMAAREMLQVDKVFDNM